MASQATRLRTTIALLYRRSAAPVCYSIRSSSTKGYDTVICLRDPVDITIPQDIRKIVLAFGPLEHVSIYTPVINGEHLGTGIVCLLTASRQNLVMRVCVLGADRSTLDLMMDHDQPAWTKMSGK